MSDTMANRAETLSYEIDHHIKEIEFAEFLANRTFYASHAALVSGSLPDAPAEPSKSDITAKQTQDGVMRVVQYLKDNNPAGRTYTADPDHPAVGGGIATHPSDFGPCDMDPDETDIPGEPVAPDYSEYFAQHDANNFNDAFNEIADDLSDLDIQYSEDLIRAFEAGDDELDIRHENDEDDK